MKSSNAKKVLLTSLLLMPLLVSCSNQNGSTSSNISSASSVSTTSTSGGQSTSSTAPVGEYAINVSASSKVQYTINKTSAKAGETIILNIVSVASGYDISNVVLNGENLTSDASGKKYSFIMPAKECQINILVSISAYNVSVSAPDGIKYTLSSSSAKPGSTVTFTITEVPASYSISSVTMNGSVLSGSNNVYSFTMPNRQADIIVKVSVNGDIVVEGDIAQAFVNEGGGLFVARDVVASGTKKQSKFNIVLKSSSSSTKINSLSLDESRSFGGITFNSESSRTEEFMIDNGYTYDFFYDTNSVDTPFYVQRKNVDILPNNETTLQNLMITTPSIRSEYAVYPTNYVGAHVEVNDKTSDDVVQNIYDWKFYDDNTSFGIVNPLVAGEADPMYVYKIYDEINDQYQVVDTFKKYQGKKLINDDRYRLDANGGGENAGTYAVIDGDDYGQYMKMSRKNAIRATHTSTHMPHYFLEREFHYAYRTGFSSDNGMSSWNIDISSTSTSSEEFTTTVSSYGEYTTTAGSSSNFAKKYSIVLTFENRGALKICQFREYKFTEAEWDFTQHCPKTATTKGVLTKSINATYTYGAAFDSSTKDFGEFSKDDYFITSFNDKLVFYNKNTNSEDDAKAGISTLALHDDICFYSSSDDGELNSLVYNKKDFFSPSTALDLWQYGPTASSNEDIICREPNDSNSRMSCINIGNADVTFSSHVEGFGPSKTININVKAGALPIYFWMEDSYQYPSPTPITSAQSANIKAGGIYNFNMRVSPSTAALQYHAVSKNTDLLNVISSDNSSILTIDVSSAVVDKNTSVIVEIESKYQESVSGNTNFTFTILPSDINPLGRWNAVDTKTLPNTYAEFTNNDYQGSVVPGMEGAKMGLIHDDVYDSGILRSSDNYYFYYKYDSGALKVVLYEIDMENPGGYSQDPDDYVLDFYYDSKTNHYGIFLAEYEYDTDYEMNWYYPILGNWVYTNPDIFEYTSFARD